MGQEINGAMWCDSCAKPVMGIRATHGIRNTLSFFAAPATLGMSLAGVKSDGFVCPNCGGPALSMDQHEKRERTLLKQRYAGAWWLATDVLRKKIQIMGSVYLGGLPDYVPSFQQRTSRVLVLDRDGVSFSGTRSPFVIRWHLIRAIVVEDVGGSSRALVQRFIENRSRLFRSPRATIVVQTSDDADVVFITTFTFPTKTQERLAAVIEQLERHPPSPAE